MSAYVTKDLISHYEEPNHQERFNPELNSAVWKSQDCPLVAKAYAYAVRKHRETNHYWDDFPYEYHLQAVANVAVPFLFYIRPENMAEVLAACWCHDLIEDCRQTYNDIQKKTNKLTAEIVFLVTTDKGRNRKERNSDQYYAGIKANENALFVKLCDRIANIERGKLIGSSMVEMYGGEHKHFKEKLYTEGQFEELWDKLESVLL